MQCVTVNYLTAVFMIKYSAHCSCHALSVFPVPRSDITGSIQISLHIMCKCVREARSPEAMGASVMEAVTSGEERRLCSLVMLRAILRILIVGVMDIGYYER